MGSQQLGEQHWHDYSPAHQHERQTIWVSWRRRGGKSGVFSTVHKAELQSGVNGKCGGESRNFCHEQGLADKLGEGIQHTCKPLPGTGMGRPSLMRWKNHSSTGL